MFSCDQRLIPVGLDYIGSSGAINIFESGRGVDGDHMRAKADGRTCINYISNGVFVTPGSINRISGVAGA